MNHSVKPANIVAAALVMQVLVSVIGTGAAFWIKGREADEFHFYENPPGVGRYAWILLPYSLVTLGLPIFSDQFWSLWRPLSGGLNLGLVSWSTALLWMFLLDVICFAALIYLTGGSYRSPFTPIFFVLPAMAFFLRESPRFVLIYVLLIGVTFTLLLHYNDAPRTRRALPEGAYWLVSVGCLVLSALVGYITRPL